MGRWARGLRFDLHYCIFVLQVLRVREMLKRGLGVHHAGECQSLLCLLGIRARCACLASAPAVPAVPTGPASLLGGLPRGCNRLLSTALRACASARKGLCHAMFAAHPSPEFFSPCLSPPHLSGLLPIVKEIVEMLFCRGVIKVGSCWAVSFSKLSIC